jgi:hypothetical protein
MTETIWDGDRRGDGVEVRRMRNDAYEIIRPGSPAVDRCHCCGAIMLTARDAKRVADRLYPSPTAPRLWELPNGEFIDPFTVQGVRVAVNRCGPYVVIDVTTSAKMLIVSCDGLNATHAWAKRFAGWVNEAVMNRQPGYPVTNSAV